MMKQKNYRKVKQSYELRATDYELEDNLENLNKIKVQISTIFIWDY